MLFVANSYLINTKIFMGLLNTKSRIVVTSVKRRGNGTERISKAKRLLKQDAVY